MGVLPSATRGSGWTALAALLACATTAHAQAPQVVAIAVDATAAGTPLNPVWPFFGYDEINYTTLPEGRALLATLTAANRAPVHVRSHFLFNTGDGSPGLKWGSTNVYRQDTEGNPVYDWRLTDEIIDTLVTLGASPFVELGFMPEALSRHPAPYRNSFTTTLNGGCFYPPVDYGKWSHLIGTWASHASERYGELVSRWRWELWNEPDIAYWHGTFAEYAELFDHTEAALHAVLPEAALGGPAVVYPGGSFLEQFLQHCAGGTNAVTGAAGTRLDLVTFHAKGGVSIVDGHVQMNLGNQLRLHRAGFAAVAAYPQFRGKPIYISEADPDGCAACPASDAPENAYRLSPAYGAYELAMMKRSLELADQIGVNLAGVLTWAFTFPGTPYFAGYRALATNGIGLPVLGAFKLLGRLTGTRLPLSSSAARPLAEVLDRGVREEPDIDGLATRGDDGVQILLWSYHDDLTSGPDASVRLTIRVPPGWGPRVRLSHLRVDERHGNAHTVWLAQGAPAAPSPAELSALTQAMEPAQHAAQQTLAVSSDGSVEATFDLPRFGVSLVELERAEDADVADAAPTITPPTHGGCGCHLTGRPRAGTGSVLLGVAVLVAFASARRARRAGLARPRGGDAAFS